jgi:DNA-binding transcriptional MerR regulator
VGEGGAQSGGAGWSESALQALERAHPQGLAVQQIVDAFDQAGDRLTEATFRKYVQLGLLPRSVRVGRKGKHKGSQGLYPVTVIRRIDSIRRLMSQGYTIDQIQREFLVVSGDVEELTRSFERVVSAIERLLEARGGDALAERQLEEARALGDALLRKLDEIEQRMSMRARMARAAV